MICIYCGGKTQVTNSRHQKRLNHNWRRRECYSCQAVFTTIETADYSSSLTVRSADSNKHSPLLPFNRDKLFVSVLRAVGHREQPLEDASALTATITAKLVANTTQAVISPADIVKSALETLRLFDEVAAIQYRAYHKL